MDDEDFQAVKVHFHITSSLVQRTCTIQLYITVSHGGLGRPCTLVVSDTCTMYAGASITFEIDAWANQCKQWSLLSSTRV